MFGYVLPIDLAGAGPDVVVFDALIVVEVEFGDAGLEKFEGGVDAAVAQVGVAYVEGDAYVVEVAYAEDFEQMLGGGDLVLQIFEQDFDAERMGEGLEMLNGGKGVFEGTGIPGLVLEAEVEGDGTEGDLLGGLDGAFDLVHGVDAAGLFRVDEVERGSDVATPLGVGVERLMERSGDIVGPEPRSEIADDGAIGVVEVVAHGEDFDGLCAALVQGVEQAGIQALLKEDVSGDSGLHLLSKLQQREAGGMWRKRFAEGWLYDVFRRWF